MKIVHHVYLGISDERTECECCGRTGLKRTIVIRLIGYDDSRVVYYGTDCAADALGTSASKVARKASSAQRRADEASERALSAALCDLRRLSRKWVAAA